MYTDRIGLDPIRPKSSKVKCASLHPAVLFKYEHFEYNCKNGRFGPFISGLRTFGKGFRIQVLERDGWKRTVIGAVPISNGWKEMAIVSNEPGDVAITGERI